MLNAKMAERLNAQINLEFYSSNLYLQMSAWCGAQGLDGCAKFLRQQADEEMEHMHRLYDYVSQTGHMAKFGAIDAPPHEFKSVRAVFEQTYEHEQMITRSINELAGTAFELRDFSTFNFLQWYVSEQHEEEATFQNILDRMALLEGEEKALFFFDKEIEALSAKRTTRTRPEPFDP